LPANSFVQWLVACLTHDASGEKGAVTAHTVVPNTVYEGFTINGNGAGHQEILHFSDAQGVVVRDVAADGASEPGGSCIHLEDVNWWTERNEFSNVSTLYGCNIGWRFTAQPANKYQPTPSFGYNRFLNIKANTAGRQTAFSFEGGSYIYNSTFRVTVNKGDVGSMIFHMQDTAKYYLNETHIFGEENGSGGFRFELGPANQFTYYGEVNLGGVADNLAKGSILRHYGDDAGYGITGPTQFYNGILWQRAVAIPDRGDLNSYRSCGIFTGKQLVNAPAALAGSSIRIEVICSGNDAYLTQIAYLMENANQGAPRMWQRLRDNGKWGPWREMGWADQLPLAATTGPLPRKAIASGSCTNLIAKVDGARSEMVVSASPFSNEPLTTGLHWDTAYISGTGSVIVPVCNTTNAPITPNTSAVFNVRVIP
jgi:hypothetical protein